MILPGTTSPKSTFSILMEIISEHFGFGAGAFFNYYKNLGVFYGYYLTYLFKF